MVRLFLLGLLMLGLGLGLRNGWLSVDWEKIRQDLHIPTLAPAG